MRFKDETEFNAAVRSVFRSAGLRALHVREADVPGPLDLIVWKGRILVCWVELKLDDEEIRPSQVEFIRNNESSCIVLRWQNEQQIMEWWGVGQRLDSPPYRMTWVEFVKWAIPLAEWATRKQAEIEE